MLCVSIGISVTSLMATYCASVTCMNIVSRFTFVVTERYFHCVSKDVCEPAFSTVGARQLWHRKVVVFCWLSVVTRISR